MDIASADRDRGVQRGKGGLVEGGERFGLRALITRSPRPHARAALAKLLIAKNVAAASMAAPTRAPNCI